MPLTGCQFLDSLLYLTLGVCVLDLLGSCKWSYFIPEKNGLLIDCNERHRTETVYTYACSSLTTGRTRDQSVI